jgi:hypothetical protein
MLSDFCIRALPIYPTTQRVHPYWGITGVFSVWLPFHVGVGPTFFLEDLNNSKSYKLVYDINLV